ncbi:MAG: tyrosine-type recombinase/integrase [Fibromonadaceae bacterium]|nr:tyrosine-type recombinase/integrase [Fibromonadaceae bacterium]
MEKKLVFGDFLVKISHLDEARKLWNDILTDYLTDFKTTAKAKDLWKTQVEKQICTIKTWFNSQKIMYYEDLTREKARSYAEWRGKRSASTVNKELLRIRAIIKFADKFLGMPQNFAFEGINVSETSENTRLVTSFSIAECKKILKWLEKKPYFHDMILLMLLTGMESKAVNLMCKEWWDIKAKLLFVFPQKISGVIDAKTQHRARKIPINKTMLEIYKRGYIFEKQSRKFNMKCQKLFRKCTVQTGIENIHCHRFRHTFASQALSAGYDIVRVSKLLGHKNINVTLKHYADFIFSESDTGFEGMVKIHKEWFKFLNEAYFANKGS